MLGLQAAAIVLGALVFASDAVTGNFIPVFILLGFFPFVGVVGLVHALFLLLLGRLTLPVALLILSSLLMVSIVPPTVLARALSPLFYGVARREDAKARAESSRAYSETLRAHYAVLSEAFQKPQKIVDADYQYLLLEDGKVLEVFGLELTPDTRADFIDYARANFVGKAVKIDLPDYLEFVKRYSPGARPGAFAGRNKQPPRDPKRNELYGAIPVLIHVGGVLINSRRVERPTCADISATCADAFFGYSSGRSTRTASARGSSRSDRRLEAATVRARWAGRSRVFATPDEAARVLIDTATANDVKSLVALFGSSGRAHALVQTGDEAQRDREVFVAAAAETWRWEDVGPNRKGLVLGNEAWPFPVPLVKGTAGWSFDADTGLEEVMNRQIGRNELAVIRLLQDYVAAQIAYAASGHDGNPAGRYARRLGSERDKQNGLYWPRRPGEPRSPLGFLFARADQGDKRNGGPTPVHGYYFRILEGQGRSATGGSADYVVQGEMTGGFAVVAWPVQHPASQRNVLDGNGVMTFIVNQEGVVYEKDLLPETTAEVRKITLYEPDGSWRPVLAGSGQP